MWSMNFILWWYCRADLISEPKGITISCDTYLWEYVFPLYHGIIKKMIIENKTLIHVVCLRLLSVWDIYFWIIHF
jgi:hypothetical protein